MARDIIGGFDEQLPGEPLLRRLMMRDGVSTTHIDVEESRRHLRRELECLPVHLRTLKPSATPYPVSFSECLHRDLDRIRTHSRDLKDSRWVLQGSAQ